MSTNGQTTNLQFSSYLPRQRNFPNEDAPSLSNTMDKAYIEIAQRVNDRTIGIFTDNIPLATGEAWFLNGNAQKEQTLRQVYQFTGAGSILHGINTTQITTFTRIYGVFTNGTNWYPLPYVDVVAANNQVNIIVTPMNIVITGGGGVGQPTIGDGIVVLEWLSTVAVNT